MTTTSSYLLVPGSLRADGTKRKDRKIKKSYAETIMANLYIPPHRRNSNTESSAKTNAKASAIMCKFCGHVYPEGMAQEMEACGQCGAARELVIDDTKQSRKF